MTERQMIVIALQIQVSLNRPNITIVQELIFYRMNERPLKHGRACK
jgi:hypothetical protein